MTTRHGGWHRLLCGVFCAALAGPVVAQPGPPQITGLIGERRR